MDIMGKEVYDSPTSMGINCVGLAIDDDAAVQEASYEEICVDMKNINECLT